MTEACRQPVDSPLRSETRRLMNRAERSGSHRSQAGTSPDLEGPALTWSEGTARLRDATLFGSQKTEPLRCFLERIFGLAEIRSVAIDRVSATATIDYSPEGLSIAEALSRMAAAIGRKPGQGETTWNVLAVGNLPWFKVFRYGTYLTTWEIVHQIPGRVRFRQEGLRGNPALARQVEHALATVHGVIDAQATPLTAGLLVHFDPSATSILQVMQVLEGLSRTPATAPPADGHHHPPVSFALANASVGLALAGELAIPALLPASAVLLLASNVKTFREAGRILCHQKIGMPVLASLIVVATLATGQFLAAALMSWTIKFWHRRYRARLHEARRRLLPELTQSHGLAWSSVGDTLVQMGDVIVVEHQELVKADGRIVSGEALVDERPIRGGRGLLRKRTGDPIFAGSWVIAGSVRVAITGHGSGTRAANLGRALLAASATATAPNPFAVTALGASFAHHAVGPTLAIAGLGLLVGDATTAAAILRPDYATGPGMGLSLHLLQDLSRAASEGVLIRNAVALRRFAEIDTIVFDDHPALRHAALRVAKVQAYGQTAEDAVLRYAAMAYGELADERARALCALCDVRRVLLFDLDLPPRYLGDGIELDLGHHGEAGPIHVREASGNCPSDEPSALLVSADGREIGRIDFERTSQHEAALVLQGLRAGGLAVGVFSDGPEDEVASLAGALGADFHQAGLSAATRADALLRYRASGHKVAYVGDCRCYPDAATAAHLAVSVTEEVDREQDEASIFLRATDLSALAGVRALSRSHVARTHAIHGSILIPNLACIAGAFLLGFTSLYAVLLTNLGTLSIDLMSPKPVPPGRGRIPNVP
jgi:cation transport ATPase